MIGEEWEVVRVIPDTLLNGIFFTKEKLRGRREVLICAHCHRPIKGKAYLLEDKYYDAYCYSLRFSLKLDGAQPRNAPPPSPLKE